MTEICLVYLGYWPLRLDSSRGRARVDILECVLAGGELAEHTVADGVCVRRGRVEVPEGLEYLAGVLRDGRGRGKDLAGAVLHLQKALATAALAALGAVFTVHLHDV